MKSNALPLSSLTGPQLSAVKKGQAPTSEQIKSAYLKAILSGSRIISGTEKTPPVENPDRAAAIRYIRESGTLKKK